MIGFIIIPCILDALHNLVPFVQFKEREKQPWGSDSFSLKLATLLKVSFVHGCFYLFKIVQMVPNRAKHLIYRGF